MGLFGGMAEAENRAHGIKPSPLKKGEPKSMSKRKVKEARFRVCCLNPNMDGALRLESGLEKLCGYGHGMTIEEMNKNLIWKGRPYIRIPYCKYCYGKNTLGVFDDTPQLLGWVVLSPDENNPLFRLAKLSAEGHRNFMKWALTTWRAGNPTYSNILKLADEVDRI